MPVVLDFSKFLPRLTQEVWGPAVGRVLKALIGRVEVIDKYRLHMVIFLGSDSGSSLRMRSLGLCAFPPKMGPWTDLEVFSNTKWARPEAMLLSERFTSSR